MKSGITKTNKPGAFFNGSSGFTLLELLIAIGLFGLVMAGSLGVYIMCQRMWRATSLSMDTSRMASLAIRRMVYGVETNNGLRAATSITISSNAHGWSISCSNKFDGAKSIDFNNQASNIYWVDGVNQSSRICDQVSSATVNNTNGTVEIQLTVWKKDGMFVSSNQVSAFVKMRN